MKILRFGACAFIGLSFCAAAADIVSTQASAPRTTTSDMTEGDVKMKTEISFADFTGKGKLTITCAQSDAGSCFYLLLAVHSRTVKGNHTDEIQEQFAFSLPARTSRTFENVLDGSTFCQSAKAAPNLTNCARQKF